MKANHNSYTIAFENAQVVSEYQRYKIWKQITTCKLSDCISIGLYQNIKDIKFESKSQQEDNIKEEEKVVSEYQRYKIWKQITTRLFNEAFTF